MMKINNQKIPRLILWSSILGHALEMYDFTLYGAFTAFIASHFFPNTTFDGSFFFALIALSVGYVARPLGAIIFGYIGDIYGRKRSLILTISVASLSTGAIGICPSYSSIGILSSLILFLARFMQGLCAGSETSDASVFLIEHCKPNYSSYGSAMIFLSGATGCLIALLISRVLLSFSYEWAWRIPFILGLVAGTIVLYMRLKVKESIEYKNSRKLNTSFGFCLFHKIVTLYSAGFLKALSCGALSGITSTTIVVFINLFLYKILTVDIKSALSFSLYGLFTFIFSCFFCSKISSNYKRNNVIMYAILGLILFSLPYFYLVGTGSTFEIILAQMVLGIFAGAFIAPTNAFLAEQFPVNLRCTGVSVGYNTGFAITSGLYPILAFRIIELTGNVCAPAVFMIVFGLLALLAITTKPRLSHTARFGL